MDWDICMIVFDIGVGAELSFASFFVTAYIVSDLVVV
jgi:hypothetical protein